MTTTDQKLHVPGCDLRAAVLEGPRANGETMDAWAKRVTFTRCTCRRHLAGLIAVVLRPFSGQRLTDQLLADMQATVDKYLAKTKERYGDNGWDVGLTRKGAEVDVHLIPPKAIEANAGEPEPKIVPPTITRTAVAGPDGELRDETDAELRQRTIRELEEQTPYVVHAMTCETCGTDAGECPEGVKLLEGEDIARRTTLTMS